MAAQRSWMRVLLVPVLLACGLAPGRPVAADDPPAPELDALSRRLDDPGSRWLALWEIGELGSAAAPLVPRVAAVLQGGHEVARRLAAESLGKIGASDPAAVAALLEALPQARGGLEDAVLRALETLGAGVAFRGALPEPITYASTPCLRALQQAYERKIVRADEVEWLHACRLEAEAHARRLESDRLFRLGEQTAANVAVSVRGTPSIGLATHWSAPFLIVGLYVPKARAPVTGLQTSVGPLRSGAEADASVEERLRVVAEVCQTVYRSGLAAHGARHGLRPLEDAWGGRPDLPEGRRSFAEGFPLQVWLAEPELLRTGALGPRWTTFPPPAPLQVFIEPDTGHLVVIPSGEVGASGLPSLDTLGWGAADTLLRAFRRQRAGWREARDAGRRSWFDEALDALWGAVERGPSGALQIVAEHPRLAVYRPLLRQSAEQRSSSAAGGAPGMRLGRLLAIERREEAAEWAITARLDPRIGVAIFRAQAGCLGQFLRDHASPDRRAQFEALTEAWLSGSLDPATARRILRLRDEDEEEVFDLEFQTWWRGWLGLPESVADPAVPR